MLLWINISEFKLSNAFFIDKPKNAAKWCRVVVNNLTQMEFKFIIYVEH